MALTRSFRDNAAGRRLYGTQYVAAITVNAKTATFFTGQAGASFVVTSFYAARESQYFKGAFKSSGPLGVEYFAFLSASSQLSDGDWNIDYVMPVNSLLAYTGDASAGAADIKWGISTPATGTMSIVVRGYWEYDAID